MNRKQNKPLPTKVIIATPEEIRKQWVVRSDQQNDVLNRAELDGLNVIAEVLYTPFGKYLMNLCCEDYRQKA